MRNLKGQFIKGTIPWVTGKKNVTGKYWLGKKRAPETIAKMSQNLKGRTAWNKGLKGFRAGLPKPWVSKRMKGNKFAFKGSLAIGARWDNSAYVAFRKQVRERDNNTCRFKNESCLGRLEVHHILPWRDYPEERYNINNGITLCQFHHPRKWEDEQRLRPVFEQLVKVQMETN